MRLLSVLFLALPLVAAADMTNRWSFNNTATSAVTPGTTLTDSISGALATVRSGTNGGPTLQASFTGTALTLPGNTTGNQNVSNISAYLDLPNGIVSSKPNLTVEMWVTPVSSKSWQRLFDFGRVNATVGPGAATGEIIDTTTTPGGYVAVDNLSLSLNNVNTLGGHRIEGRFASGTQLGANVDLSGSTSTGTEYHYVLTVTDGAGLFGASGCRASFYRNGTLQQTVDLNFRLSQMSDVNNWIGRSQYGMGTHSTSNITINELRLYNHTLSAAEVSASFAAGPNPTYTAPVTQADAATMHTGQKVRLAVLANDTGPFSGPTVAIVQPPQFGTATPTSDGTILYRHTTGTPASDTFTYRVSGPGGSSTPATVTITFSYGLRIANGTLNVPATPPATATQFVNAFGQVTFSAPICMRSPAGDTKRLFVAERGGGLRVIPDVTVDSPTSSLVLSLTIMISGRSPTETLSLNGEQGFLSFALHPNFASNGFAYLFYSVIYNGATYERVSRVTIDNPSSATPTANNASEQILIEQLDEQSNHNGGDMHFGPDGYLYISLGDEGNQYDKQFNSQRLDKDFFCSILRIDVDKKPGSVEPAANPNAFYYPGTPPADAVKRSGGIARYSIPQDNPFLHTSQGGTWNGSGNYARVGEAGFDFSKVRSEIWAHGFRNPWRFSFDPPTGELWCGDVGQDTYEEVNIITRGGNYGWVYREGVHNTNFTQQGAEYPTPTPPAGFSTDPIYEYRHGSSSLQGNSVTGGVVYRGTRFPTLTGAYIFGDFVTGNIWALRRTPTVTVERITGENAVAAFGVDPSNGDVLAAGLTTGIIRRLVVDSSPGTYPNTLSETRLFADLTDLSPSPSVLPYAVNLPFWSDFAVKSRWFSIPDGTSRMTWSRDGLWTFPSGTIWVKHFDMEMTRGNPATKKRIETRLLVRNSTGAYGVSYRWNDAQTEASLVGDAGDDFDLAITDGGAPYTQHWHIPTRSECLACHTPPAGHGLSFSTRQINLLNSINGFAGNQLDVLRTGGYFSNTPESANVLPRHVRPDEISYPLEARARSYFAVNCAQCHRAGGTAAPAVWDGRPELTLEATGLINGPASNNGGSAANKLVVPGDTAHSIVLNRMAVANGFTRMPPLASNELDQTNIALITSWITQSLPTRQTYADWRLAQFGSATSTEGDPDFDADYDAMINRAEFLFGTQPLNAQSAGRLQIGVSGATCTCTFTTPANRSGVIETTTDLVNWSLWDAPGNNGIPLPGGAVNLTGPKLGTTQYFRLRLSEN